MTHDEIKGRLESAAAILSTIEFGIVDEISQEFAQDAIHWIYEAEHYLGVPKTQLTFYEEN